MELTQNFPFRILSTAPPNDFILQDFVFKNLFNRKVGNVIHDPKIHVHYFN